MARMTEDQIPDFVSDVVVTGCDITAVMSVGYVIGDADLTEEQYELAAPELRRISELYGERDHLLDEITNYLISIGRFFPARSVAERDAPPAP
jgi:hypothetical protein